MWRTDNDSAGIGTPSAAAAATHRDSDASNSSSDSDSDSSDSDSESDIEMTDTEDTEDSEDSTVYFNQSAFEVLLAGRLQPGIFEDRDLEPPQAFRYQRRLEPSLRTVQRKESDKGNARLSRRESQYLHLLSNACHRGPRQY